ncbi:Filamentous hemagglutinin [Sebaldella termitidis]|uniref:Adhesin HecA family n=1 Tax=Sebaldella termitidis (strain ATCC 33386 / NCTC 11300) TaxID=526218 RepID=D1AG88_SEBTE|nr:hemagglutinin repeat-containing protein [Sebaldella termitidis]ACZ10714.1 adhesin HecA family [Sebaldella termitidis ATCC 33386]SUI26055.1 Filamentous hemagglutinin [Sebaldella termitidis]
MKERNWKKVVRRNLSVGILLGMFLNNLTFANELIKTRNGSTRVITAPNGTPMIELANPGNSGVSVNDFDRLSVDEKNLILNNISSKEGIGYRSELGGIIAPNENYTGNPARAILLRVHKDPSVINGFIEAASTGKVDMFFSNPNGIYLNGGLVGRFGNVTFTTGHVSDDLMTIMVRDGRIEIGSGFNGNAAENLSLLAKSIQINGQLNGNDLTLIGGQYDYNTGTKEVVKQGDNPGEVLISSSVVGSIYGRNIYLKAVGSDIGVKGDMVSQKVLKINADGSLVLSKIQGTESVDIKAKNFTQEGSTYTEGKLTVEADNTTLKGSGTQAQEIEVSGNLNNESNLYSKGNVTIGGDTQNKGQLISEGNLEVKGNLESDSLVYGKNSVKVGKDLTNKSDLQSENGIAVEGNVINTGKVISDKDLTIKGNANNAGTLYGKDRVTIDKNLTNTGSVQTTGDLTAKDTVNTGKLTAEGNVNVEDLDNNGEIVTNKKLTTKNLTNKSTGKVSAVDGISTVGNAVNHGQINTNGSFVISSNLENYNVINVGGLVNTKDLTNTGVLKVSDKIVSKGFSFSNTGEIVTVNLDVDSTNIINTNKITVVETTKLKGSSNINNQGTIASKNIEITTPVLTNSGQILAEEVITANNTSLTNTGKLASNGSINLNNTSIVNRSSIESATINLQNIFSYDNNTGIIRGNNITLTSLGNLLLEGRIQGINNLLISGFDITNNGNIISSGLLRLSGNNITNNLTISASTVELLATGNILNNSMIEGERGKLSGNNITNKDLVIFLDKLDIEGTKLVNKDASVYSDNEMNIKTGDVDNTGGEIVGQSTLNITGFNLLDNTKGIIDSRGNILLSGNKLLNGGEVSGQYRLYWITWDGQYIYDDVWRELDDAYAQTGNSSLITGLDDWKIGIAKSNINGGINREKEFTKIKDSTDYDLYYGYMSGNLTASNATYETQVLKGYVDTSRLVTEGGRILSGGNLTLDVKEIENRNSKISSGGTLRITNKVEKIENVTDVATIKVYDGTERLSLWQTMWTNGSGNTIYGDAIGVRRDLESTSRDYNIADSVSVIEGNNVIIEGTPTINNGYDYSKIGTGIVIDPSTITSKDVDVDLYYDPVTVHVDRTAVIDIITTGTIPFNPGVFTSSQSKLFAESKDPTSKYLMETRSQYIDLSRFFGSDYFLSKIGYNESKDWNMARRLGDAYYETKYMNNLLLETLGTRFINGKADTELMKEMLDNAVATSGDLQLTIGVALTGAQIAALKSDIIWYVEQEVNGEKVLVPQVYLSQATLENIKSPTTTISAQETLAINSSTLVNQGRLSGNTVYVNTDNLINKSVGALTAEITGMNIQIDAKNDILNIGAVISAKEDLMLTAGGTISNITTGVETTEHDRLEGKERTRIYDDIQNVGVISSGNITYIEADNYVSRGAVTESGGTTYIEANDVNINTIALKDYERTEENHGYDLYRTTEKLGSEVTGLNNVIINASNDINIKGSTVASDGTVQLTAENNINIENDKNTMYTESKREKNGTFSSYYKLETNYQEEAVASTIIGNNIILDSGNDVNIKASNVIAVKNDNIQSSGGNIIVTAGNDINITTDDMNNEYYLKEKSSGFSSSFSMSGGGVSAGVSYSSNSLENTRNTTTVATSSIVSEGSTLLSAGNKVRTEAMQANVGEDMIIRGVNGVELLDAQEVYNEKVKQESKSVGITASLGSTITSFISSADEKSQNNGKYGFGNRSELINTYGDGLDLYREGVKAGADLSQLVVDGMKGSYGSLGGYGVTANVTVSANKSKYESNTSGTNSVAGNINVGGNLVISSEGDVKLVNQKVNVGENIIVDAKSFEASAGKNTYNNTTDSSSQGMSAGYDFTGGTVTGGINGSKGNSNSSSVYYDNTIINAGGTFQLTTKEDATFKGANVTADKIDFEIGGNLNVISLQDEYKLDGSNKSGGLNYGHTEQSDGKGYNSVSGSASYGESSGDSKWVNNQTSIIAENGGNIKVGETLTNVGAIIGSINESMRIEAKEVIVENLKDHDNGENYNVGLSGVDRKNTVPQTELQYGSHDKEQDTNATFVNTVIVENGREINLEERGINTDINKAQVITKDDVVEQIDTVLHTDLLNKEKQKDLLNDLNTIGENSEIIVDSIGTKLNNNKNGDPNAGMGDLEKQSLANITKAVEEVVKNKDNLVLSEADRENKEKLKETIKDKYADYGVTDVVIIKDGELLMGEDGEMHSVNGAFSRDGIVYITESTANGSLKDLNRVVGEEVGEIYAQNNGLENWNNKGQQIGEIFGEKISEGLGDSKSKNNLSSDDIDLSGVIIAGTQRKTEPGVWLVIDGDSSKPISDLIVLGLRANAAKNGYKNATDNILYYLSGQGGTKEVPMDWYLNSKVGKQAITDIKWGIFDIIDYNDLSSLKIGQNTTIFDYAGGEKAAEIYPDPKIDGDLFYSMGPHNIDYSRSVNIRKIGENKYELKSQVDYTIRDNYDWHDGKSIQEYGIKIEDKFMKGYEEKNYGAKEFKMRGYYSVEFTAIFEMKNGIPVTTTNYTREKR